MKPTEGHWSHEHQLVLEMDLQKRPQLQEQPPRRLKSSWLLVRLGLKDINQEVAGQEVNSLGNDWETRLKRLICGNDREGVCAKKSKMWKKHEEVLLQNKRVC